MIHLGCLVAREAAPGGGGGASGEMRYAAVERSIQPLARRRGEGRPRPLPHDRSSCGSSCLFLPLPSEPAVPMVGQSSPAGRRATEGYPPGWPRRRAVERRPPLVAAAPTPCLGYAPSPPVRTPPHRWLVASRRVVVTRRRCLRDCRHRRGAERQQVTRLAGRGDGWLGGGWSGGVLLWR